MSRHRVSLEGDHAGRRLRCETLLERVISSVDAGAPLTLPHGLIALVLPGIPAVVAGAALAVRTVAESRRRRRLFGTKLTPISKAPTDAIVAIAETVIAEDDRTVAAPFSNRNVVCFETRVHTWDGNQRSEVLDVRDSREFFVEDGSGVRARIAPKDATMLVEKRTLSLDEGFDRQLAEHKLDLTTLFGLRRRYEATELSLAPGAKVFVVGPSRRATGPAVADGYRTRASTELVLYRRPGAAGVLTISDQGPDQLAARSRRTTRIGLAVAASGVAMIALSVLALLDYRP